MLTVGSLAFSLWSDQSAGWKIADTGASLAGLFGGAPGALVSVGYGFSVKPLIKAVVEPTPDALRSMYHHHIKYCNKNSCQ